MIFEFGDVIVCGYRVGDLVDPVALLDAGFKRTAFTSLDDSSLGFGFYCFYSDVLDVSINVESLNIMSIVISKDLCSEGEDLIGMPIDEIKERFEGCVTADDSEEDFVVLEFEEKRFCFDDDLKLESVEFFSESKKLRLFGDVGFNLFWDSGVDEKCSVVELFDLLADRFEFTGLSSVGVEMFFYWDTGDGVNRFPGVKVCEIDL